jgi:hypothetical protein
MGLDKTLYIVGGLVAVMVLLLAAVLGGPGSIFDISRLGLEAKVKEQAAAQLRDPSSAQFRNIKRNQGFVCGEINGKNGFGAYAGFKRFYGTDGGVTIDPGDDGLAFEGGAFLKGMFDKSWSAYCAG